MHGPGPAEGEEGKGAGVLPALDSVYSRRVRHVLVDDLVDTPGGLDGIQAERAGDLFLDTPKGGLAVESYLPTEEELGVEVAQDQVRVGHRRFLPATAVAGWPRVGAGAPRSDLRQAQRADAGDRSTARADLDHLYDSGLNRQARAFLEPVDAGDLELIGTQRLSTLDQARFGRRPTHVE